MGGRTWLMALFPVKAAGKMGAALPQFSLKCADFPPKKALHRVDDIGKVAFEEREQ
jgi:hypothetical protein